MNDDAQLLRTAAEAAHGQGHTNLAAALFRQILELYPLSNEGQEAMYYLTSGRRLPPKASAPQADDGGGAETRTA
jgi:hypothetical protein